MPDVRIIARATARKGKEEELKGLAGVLAPTHAEPGCKVYELYASDTSGRFYFYEWWKSKDALEKHAASPLSEAHEGNCRTAGWGVKSIPFKR